MKKNKNIFCENIIAFNFWNNDKVYDNLYNLYKIKIYKLFKDVKID